MKRLELRQIVAEAIEVDVDELDSDSDLTMHPTFDSVSILGLMITLDDRFGIRMTPADASKLRNLADIERLALQQGIILTD